MILTDLFESPEIHNRPKLDSVLARCIELIHEKNAANPKKYGRVAACIIDMKNRKVFGINSPGADGRRRHAERIAIDAYHKRYGKILPGAIIVTTLSPCNRPMAERDGPSCQDLLMQAGIEKVYSGYMDPSQHSDHPFTEETTKNDQLWEICKQLSDSFVHDDLTEGTENRADAQQVLDYIHGTHHEPLTKQLQQAVLSYPQWQLKTVPLSSLHIPDQEYDDEEQDPEADPYNRVQAIDPDHAGEYSANFVDRRPIVVDRDGWIIDGNHRAWAAAELLNKYDIKAWVPASQLNELGNAPAEYKPNRKRSRSLFHATVDGQWVDVFFDRSEFNGTLHITFAVNGDYDAPSQPTSASKSTVRILSTVLNIVKKQLPEYMAKARPPGISFTSKQDNRTSLYRKYFVPVIQDILGAKWQHEEYPSMGMTVFHWKPVKKSGVAEGLEQTPDQVRQTLNAWMNQDQQYEDPTERAPFQAQVWPYIQQNIKTILADKGEKGNGDYPAAPYAAWLLVQHMDVYPQNQIEFYNALKQAIPNHPKIQFLRDRAAVNQWIMKNANNPEYFIKGKALPNPTVNVRNPDMFRDAGIVATSREEALANAEQAGNKLLVAAVNATNAQTQPSYKQSANENFADGKGPGRPGDSVRHGIPKKATMAELEKASHAKGRKGQLARWQLNMRRGRKKTNEVTVGVLNLGEFAINVDDHAFERAQQRKINLADIDTVLRKIKLPRVIKKIMDIDVGNRFYVLDHVTDVALGFRRIGDKKLVLKTVYSGRPMDLNIAGIITV